ncbi:MFS transporter [Candidatus Harpocratesius sp.]
MQSGTFWHRMQRSQVDQIQQNGSALQSIKKQKRNLKYKSIRPLWFAVFSDIIGFSLLTAVFPDFTRLFNISFFQVSIIASLNGLFSFLSAPIWGKLSDKYGRKPLLQLSQIGTIFGFILLAFANSYYMILISRIVDGIFGGNFPISKAVINDVVEPQDMAMEMTNIGIAHNFANLFAPALGGFLYSQFGLAGPGLAAAFTSIFTFTITLLRLPETAPIKTGKTLHIINHQSDEGRMNGETDNKPIMHIEIEHKSEKFEQSINQSPILSTMTSSTRTPSPKTASMGKIPIEKIPIGKISREKVLATSSSTSTSYSTISPLQSPRLLWYKHTSLIRALLILALSSFGFMTIISNLANFGYKKFGLDTSEIGILLMITAIIQLTTRFSIYMPALKKWGEYRLAIVGFLLYIIEFTVFIFISQIYQFIIMLVFHSLATSATRGSISSFISNLANPWERGKVQGIASSIDTFAQIIGPLIGGALITFLPLQWFTSFSLILMVAAISLLLSSKEMHKELKKKNKNFHHS